VKKWATTVIGWSQRHPSRRAVERYIEVAASEFRAGSTGGAVREVKVWMDDGAGFQLQEIVPLTDTAKRLGPPVDGCRFCGTVPRDHPPLSSFGVGLHRWTAPSEGQIRARGALS